MLETKISEFSRQATTQINFIVDVVTLPNWDLEKSLLIYSWLEKKLNYSVELKMV